MNAVLAPTRADQWQHLKRLVLDSVSSPITRRVYNLALDEFFGWFPPGAARRIHEGDGECVAIMARCS